MATAMSTMTPVERTHGEGKRIDRQSIGTLEEGRKGPLKEYYRENDGGMGPA